MIRKTGAELINAKVSDIINVAQSQGLVAGTGFAIKPGPEGA